MPMRPPAPALVSITTGCFQITRRRSASVRAITSSELPAGAGTITRTGFDGQACAHAPAVSTLASRRKVASWVVFFTSVFQWLGARRQEVITDFAGFGHALHAEAVSPMMRR